MEQDKQATQLLSEGEEKYTAVIDEPVKKRRAVTSIEIARSIANMGRLLANGLHTMRSGNQRGDQFYLRLQYKRKNGKWGVQGSNGYRKPKPEGAGILPSSNI